MSSLVPAVLRLEAQGLAALEPWVPWRPCGSRGRHRTGKSANRVAAAAALALQRCTAVGAHAERFFDGAAAIEATEPFCFCFFFSDIHYPENLLWGGGVAAEDLYRMLG